VPFIPPTYANATFVIQRAGDLDPYTTSLGVSYTGPWSNANADSLAASLRTAALPNLSAADTLVSIDWAYNDVNGVLAYSSALGSAGTGATLVSTIPQNSAALIVKRTSTPGRKGRGRMYWPYVGEVDTDGIGALNPAAVTRYQTMTTAWVAAITSAATFDQPVLFHTLSSPAPSPITSFSCSPVVASQRRRLRR
jgi:hypothetical protein